MTKKAKIIAHGDSLLEIFPDAIIKEPTILYRELRKIEKTLHQIAERDCNYGVNIRVKNNAHKKAMAGLVKLLRPSDEAKEAFIFNGDPRGYALKLDETWTRELRAAGRIIASDWGGYGLLAPEFNN